jgi:hypothetical protein
MKISLTIPIDGECELFVVALPHWYSRVHNMLKLLILLLTRLRSGVMLVLRDCSLAGNSVCLMY